MNDDAPFYRAMAAAPNDDLPWLVYADWLADHVPKASPDRTHGNPLLLTPGVKFNGDGYGDGSCGDGKGDGSYGYSAKDGDDEGSNFGGSGGDGDGGCRDRGSRSNYGDENDRNGEFYNRTTGSITVKTGVYIVTIPGGYSPYILVGRMIVNGLEVKAVRARIIHRLGSRQSLAELAANGPASDTELLPPSAIENLWRPSIGRAVPVNPNAWQSHIEGITAEDVANYVPWESAEPAINDETGEEL